MRVLTGTPGLSRGLVTSLLAHGIWLTLVLRNASVDGLDDVRSNGRSEDLFSCNQLVSTILSPTSSSILPTQSQICQLGFRGARTFGRG
jgi:hypothetical protein